MWVWWGGGLDYWCCRGRVSSASRLTVLPPVALMLGHRISSLTRICGDIPERGVGTGGACPLRTYRCSSSLRSHCPPPGGAGGARSAVGGGLLGRVIWFEETGEGDAPPSPSAPPPVAIPPRSTVPGFFLASAHPVCRTATAIGLFELLPSRPSQPAPLVLLLRPYGPSQPAPAGAQVPGPPSPAPTRNQK